MTPMSEDAETPEVPNPAADTGNGETKGGEANDGLLIEVDTSDLPAAKIAALEAQLAKQSQDKKDLWDKFVRASADLENFRKRSRRDLEDARHEARSRILKEMLPVVDNLERAVQHSNDASDVGTVLEGVRLVLRQFTHAFERTEVTVVEAEGQPFDPNLHEAIGQQESELPPGTVVNVLQRGYKLGDKLLRPALVVVAKAKSAPAAAAVEAEPAASPAPASDAADIPVGDGGTPEGGG